MALAAIWSAFTGLLFYRGLERAGMVAGLLMTAAALTVATTQFCLGAWVWHRLGLTGGATDRLSWPGNHRGTEGTEGSDAEDFPIDGCVPALPLPLHNKSTKRIIVR